MLSMSSGLSTVCTFECVTFSKTSRYQGILKATVSGVFEDIKFKISEGYKLRQPIGQSQENFNFGPSLLKC